MASRYHKVRVQFPSGKTFERECFRYDEDEAARVAVWTSYMDHKEYNPAKMDGAGNQWVGAEEVARLPEGWGQMSDDEKYAIAVAAGYKALAVASYVDQQLTWRAL